MPNYDIKMWLRLNDDGTYRIIMNPGSVIEGDTEVIMPFSYEDVE